MTAEPIPPAPASDGAGQQMAPLLRLVVTNQPGKPTFTRPPAGLRAALARRTALDPVGDKELIDAGDRKIADADRAAAEAAEETRRANRVVSYLRRRPPQHADAKYETLRADPRGLVSRWFRSDRRAVLLAGNARAGKSTAAYAICNDANARGVWVEAWTAFDLWRTMRAEGDDGPCWHQTTGCDLLLIDDLGSERVTDAWREHLTAILEARLGRRKRLIVTANTPTTTSAAYQMLVDEPAEGGYGYGTRLVERIIDGGGFVIFDGPPLRDLEADW